MRPLRVAAVQLRSGLNVAANVEAASALIREAAAGGAEFIATPEYTALLDQRPGGTWAGAVGEDVDPALAAFRALAAELKVTLLIGSLAVRVDDRRCANRSFLIGPDGRVAARYDKIHLFDVQVDAANVYRESDSFVGGGQSVVADVAGKAKLGFTICYDLRFPHLHRDLAKAGAEIIAAPAAFTAVTGRAHWHVLLRARAIETGSFVIAPAQAGLHEDGRETFGHSLIINPWGEILAEAGTERGVIAATIDLDEVGKARAKIPALQHDRAYGSA
jgi:predicted amidohydrolase